MSTQKYIKRKNIPQRKNRLEDVKMSELNSNLQNQQSPQGDQQEAFQDIFDPADIEKNKTMAGLAYLIFFLPLIVCPDSKYGKFHANQGLLLFIAAVAGNIVLGIIPIIGWILMPIYGLGILVFAIMGLINGLGGKAKRLPIIGKFNIIK
jgi:uncharacterized membrane protein